MAARLHPEPVPEIVDLRHLQARDLEALLLEECTEWLQELEWDFGKSADLVRRFVDMRALNGCALVERDSVVGYMYYVLEDDKGLIGDLYVRPDWRTAHLERLLLEAALQPMMAIPGVTRIESQLMMLPHDPVRDIPYAEHAGMYGRNFMRIELTRAELGKGRVRRPVYFEKWSDHYNTAAAQLIADAYAGHTDSRINDQYRSVSGARKFLYNIVQYPGCGNFFRPASYAAFEPLDGSLCGLSLTTLREVGCRSATLTVTSNNDGAVALYESVGFETIRQFSAFVWEGF